jgi:5'-3' exonuclease
MYSYAFFWVDILVDAYRQTVVASQKTIITCSQGVYGIDMSSLNSFITHLTEQEDELMGCVTDHFNRIIPRPQRNFTNCVNIIRQQNPKWTLREAQEKAVRDFGNDYEEFPLRNKPLYATEINPKNDSKWRASYYNYVFGDNSPETIKRSCDNYLDGLFWVVNYYFNQHACTEWYCHLHYAPTIHDIHKYMYTLSDRDVQLAMQRLMTNADENMNLNKAHLQLLLVLPPQSIELLPNELQHIMTKIEYGCVHFYPYDFKVMTYLKHKLWECTPMIPHIDIKKVIGAMNKIMLPKP